MLERFLDAERNRLGGKQPLLHPRGLKKRVTALFRGGVHDTEERVPIDQSAPGQVSGTGVEQTKLIGADENKTGFVETAAPGAAEHLENLIGAEQLVQVIATVRIAGQRGAAQK